jgi:hypothetical protein
MGIYDTHKPSSGSGFNLKLEDGETVTIRIASEPVIYQAESQEGNLSTRYGWIIWNQTAQIPQILEQSARFFQNSSLRRQE